MCEGVVFSWPRVAVLTTVALAAAALLWLDLGQPLGGCGTPWPRCRCSGPGAGPGTDVPGHPETGVPAGPGLPSVPWPGLGFGLGLGLAPVADVLPQPTWPPGAPVPQSPPWSG